MIKKHWKKLKTVRDLNSKEKKRSIWKLHKTNRVENYILLKVKRKTPLTNKLNKIKVE